MKLFENNYGDHIDLVNFHAEVDGEVDAEVVDRCNSHLICVNKQVK